MDRTGNLILGFAVALGAGSFVCGCALFGGSRGGAAPASSAEPAAPATQKSCSAAEAIFRVRGSVASKQHPWRLVGFRSLKGPLPCPAQSSAAPLPEALPETLTVLEATSGQKWQTREQDPEIGDDVVAAQFTYQSYDVVFAEEESGDHGRPPVKEGYNDWIDHLHDARPIFDRFYVRHHLSGSAQMAWDVKNVYECFAALGKGDYCSAESDGQIRPTSEEHGNQLPEALFCAGYAHLHHPLLEGSCHTAGRVNSPAAKCVFACMERQQNCEERVGGSPASLLRNEVQRKVACQEESNRCQAGCNGGDHVSMRGRARAHAKRRF